MNRILIIGLLLNIVFSLSSNTILQFDEEGNELITNDHIHKLPQFDNTNEDGDDVFESKRRLTTPEYIDEDITTRRGVTRKSTRRPTKSTIRRSTQPVSQIDSELDNEFKVKKLTTRHNTKSHRTTTPRPLLIDNEVSTIPSNVYKTTSYPISTISQQSSQSTNTLSIGSTETRAKVHIGDSVIVDGEAGTNYQTTHLPYLSTNTPSKIFNPWDYFTTFPPFLFATTVIPDRIDYAPNCLTNAALCREGGTYEKYMRTYCKETCRLYDNTSPRQAHHENQGNQAHQGNQNSQGNQEPTETGEYCRDIADNCASLQHSCSTTNSPYYFLLKQNCRKTCQLCQSTSQTPNNPDINVPPFQPYIQPNTFIPPFLNLPSSLPPFSPFQPFDSSPRIGPPLEPQIPIDSYDGECRDLGQNCQQFEADCNKASMTVFLHKYCAATCGFCSSCQDSLPGQCVDFIRRGFCESSTFRLAIKKRYCKKSCNLCDPLTQVHPDFSSQFTNLG